MNPAFNSKANRLYWIIFGGLLIIMGCKKDSQNTAQHPNQPAANPTACFTIIDSLPVIYDTVYFSSCSANNDSVMFSFGDGQYSDSAHAKHVYTAPGTYQVKLTAFKGGDTNSVTKIISVSQGIYGNYGTSGSSCISSNVIISYCNPSLGNFYLTFNPGPGCVGNFGSGSSFSIYYYEQGGEQLLMQGPGSFSANLDTLKLNLTLVSTSQLGVITTTYCSGTYIRQ
jgi:hypothetical protein